MSKENIDGHYDYAKKAFMIDNRNSITLWHLGNAYSGAQNEMKAIEIWKLLIESSPEEIGLKRTIWVWHGLKG